MMNFCARFKIYVRASSIDMGLPFGGFL